MRRRPPRTTRTDTLFPYTTLFRSEQHLVALVGEGEDAVFTLHREQPAREQLPHHPAPFGIAQIGADAEHREFVVPMLGDLLVGLAEQDVDEVTRAEQIGRAHV